MMKTLIGHIAFFLILLLSLSTTYGQNLDNLDSAKKALQVQADDTNKVKLLYKLSFFYDGGSYADTALIYAQQALDLAEKLHDEPGIFWSEITLGEALAILGNYPLALEYDFRALALAKKLGDTIKLCYGNGSLAACYYYMGDYTTSIKYARVVLGIMDSKDNYWMWIQMSKAFHGMGQPDSALLYAGKAYEMLKNSQNLYARSVVSPVLGNAYAGMADYDSALLYYQIGIPLSLKTRTEIHLVDNYNGIAGVYKSKGNLDSALWYCKKIVAEKITKSYPAGLLIAANMLAEIYRSKSKPDSSLKYLRIAISIKDSLSNRQKTIAVQNLIYKEQEKQKEIEAVRLKFRNQLITYVLIGGLLALMIIGGILLRHHRQKQIQKIRNGIADDLHDDIGSTLSSISIMSELAKARSPQVSGLLDSIGESTASVQENMSDIVWAIKSENDSFENVLQRMNQFSAEILDAKDIALDLTIDPSLSTARLTMKQRKSFYLFFKEIINNAAKHSRAKNIVVSIIKKENLVEMIIRDDGKGFDTNESFNGNGMNTLKKRAEELNGHFTIQSRKNEGTKVELTFKIT